MHSEMISHSGNVNSLSLEHASSPANVTQPPAAQQGKNAARDIYATGEANVLVGDSITIQGGTSFSIYNNMFHSSFEKLLQICYEMILSEDDDEDTTGGLTFGNGSSSNAQSAGNQIQYSIQHGSENLFGNDVGQSTQKNGIISATELEMLMSNMTTDETMPNSASAAPKQVKLLETILNRIQPQETHVSPGAPGDNGLGKSSGRSELLTRFQKLISAKKEERDAKVARMICEWLLPQQLDQNIYESSIRLKLQNTCDWILDRRQFSQWVSPDFDSSIAKALWIHGLPGFGKTFLCARIIKHLQDTVNTPIGHFFISSGNASQYDPFIAIRSWLVQTMSHKSIFQTIRRIWKSRRSERLSQQTTMEIFKAVAQETPGCTFILDGLDECSTPQNTRWQTNAEVIDDFLAELWDAISQAKTRILLISRDDPSIRDSIPSDAIYFAEYGISLQDVKSDVLLYARDVIEKKSRKVDALLKENLAEKMSERCQGQFIWIKFIQSSLSRRSTQDQLETAIREAPDGMDSFYSRNWTRVMATGSGNIAYAIETLRWVTFAIRPLTISELVEALMIDLDASELSIKGAPIMIDEDFVENLVERCAGLIEIRDTGEDDDGQSNAVRRDVASRTVHLPHHSVKEFLLQATISTEGTRSKQETEITSRENNEHAKLTRLCLQYLNYESTWQKLPIKRLENFPVSGQDFQYYASKYWYRHIKSIEKVDKETYLFVNNFFAPDNCAWDAWERWSARHDRVLEQAYHISDRRRMHYACQLGLEETVHHLLYEQPNMLESPTCWGQRCLRIACIAGHTAIVEMLLSANAKLDIRLDPRLDIFELVCLNGHLDILNILLNAMAPTLTLDARSLHAASRAGHVEIVRVLLKQRMQIAKRQLPELTALWFAATRGHIEVVRLLLDSYPYILVDPELVLSPLYGACDEGHIEVVRLLLQRGVDIDCADHQGYTPLHAASFAGSASIVQLLIENNAQPNVYATGDYAPIHMAAKAGNTDVLKLLLDHGISPELKTMDGVTPLSLASTSDSIDAVQLLLERNADFSTTCNQGRQPIHHAADYGKTNTVSLLIDHNMGILANTNDGQIGQLSSSSIVEATDVYGWTPLHYAASNNYSETGRLLIEKGANTMAVDNNGWTPLHYTAINNYSETAKLLIEQGASMMAVDNGGWTPFHFAASQPNADTMRVLLQYCADMDTLQSERPTPLHVAAAQGQVEVMRLLLERGADVNSTVKEGWTPAHCAAQYHQYESLHFLIEQHVDIAIADNEGWTAMHYAISVGDADMVDLLIEVGADVSAVNTNGVSPVAVAGLSGYVELVQLLLDHGADASQADGNRQTPLIVMAKYGYLAAVQLLLASAPSAARELDIMQRSAFFYAVARGHTAIAKLLFRASSDVVTTKDYTGTTALERAARQGYTVVVEEIVAMLPPSHITVTLPDSSAKNLKPAAWQKRMLCCDVCIQNIMPGVYYACVVCMEGDDFSMCEKCYQDETKCLDATHRLVQRGLPIAQG